MSDDTKRDPKDDEALTFRLISVNFKEASMDSPSFRASINHLDTQITHWENWCNALSNSVSKVPKKANDLRVTLNSFTEYMLPSFRDDGLIDQETTVPLAEIISESHVKLFNICLDILYINPKPIQNMLEIITALVQRYRRHKKQFNAIQAKYDEYYSVYMSSSKFRDSQVAIEDAYQFFHVRREYLQSCLDLVMLNSEISNTVDIQALTTSCGLWHVTLKKGLPIGLEQLYKDKTYLVNRTRSWTDLYQKSVNGFLPDVKEARQQVERATAELFEPSLDPADYDASLINSTSLRDIEEDACEKHGYLLMKTWVKSSTKPIWVKRWIFVKGGLFGMLLLSPSKLFVQESDKIGVLLINMRYAAQETRNFCFELRTTDQVLTFQAESFIEMKSWFKVFENEKNRLLSEGSTSPTFIHANRRYPPLIAEFASTVNTIIDRQMTNTKIKDESGEVVSSLSISKRIQQNEKYFQKYLYNQIPLFRPPLVTSNTKTAIVAYSIAPAITAPTALTANIWGSVNWGIYYLNIEKKEHSIPLEFISEENSCHPHAIRDEYPPSYPPAMVPIDIEMRALFETAIETGELCLVSFSCLWSPNSNQELLSKVFITNRHFFLCNQVYGFRSLYKIKMGRLTDIENTPAGDHDDLKFHLIQDMIVIKIYLESGELLRRKIKHLMDYRNSESRSTLDGLVKGLVKIEKDFQQEMKSIKLINHIQDTNNASLNIIPDSLGISPVKIEIPEDIPLISTKHYSVPAKALFHIIMGEHSNVIRDSHKFPLKNYVKSHYVKMPDGLFKNTFYSTKSGREPVEKRKFLTDLTIETMIEEQYYVIKYVREYFTFFGSAPFSVVSRYDIEAENTQHCVVRRFYQLKFKSLRITNLFTKLLAKIMIRSEIHTQNMLIQKSVAKIGTQGQVGKAIFYYGKLPVLDTPNQPIEPVVCRLGIRNVIYGMILEPTVCSFCDTCTSVVEVVTLLLTFLKSITAQRLLLFMLVLSAGLNLFLISKTTYTYWLVSYTNSSANKLFNSEPSMLQRAVYLKDSFEVIHPPELKLEDSPCLESFEKVSFIKNFELPVNWNKQYFDGDTQDVAIGLKKTFQEIGIKRHKLLVEFNILNHMEEEIAKGEYRNWLVSELRKCALIDTETLAETLALVNDNVTEIAEGLKDLSSYCDSCAQLYEALGLL